MAKPTPDRWPVAIAGGLMLGALSGQLAGPLATAVGFAVGLGVTAVVSGRR